MAGELIYDEQMAKDPKGPPKWLVEKRAEAVDRCRLFYDEPGHRRARTRYGFPWECGAGWNDVLATMSYRIEALNLALYPRYRVRCVAEQIKEKFGTLRAYTRTAVDPPAWKTAILNAMSALAGWLCDLKVDYAMERVVDRARHVEYRYEQLTKERFEQESSHDSRCVNVSFFEHAGKYYRVTSMDVYETSHSRPTKHLFLHRIRAAAIRAERAVNSWAHSFTPSREQTVMSEFMDAAVASILDDAERKCYCRCEGCGTEIGTDYSPRCETRGWITYLCKKCACKRGEYSVRGGDLMGDDKEAEDED